MKYAICALALLASFGLSHQTEAAPRPNILYFYVDDLGWGAIGPNGQAARKEADKPFVKTPNLDKLAAAGVNFTRCYGCTVCSPARSSQQTGFHQGHTFGDRNDPNNAKKAMRADDICMGEALAAAEYVTGYWGKWGYGGSASIQSPKIDNVQTLPTSHGYEHVLAELHHVRAHTFFQPTLWSAPAKAGAVGGIELVPNSMKAFRRNPAYPEHPSNHNHADYPSIAYCDDCYAFAALDFVRTQAQHYNKSKQPFFALLAVQIPHAPFAEITRLPEWDKAYADDPHFEKLAAQSRQWAAMVTRIDAHFGNILAALEDPNGDGDTSDAVADNTLVVFQSDNGGPGGSSCKEYDANGGLRGNKGSIYEGGIRIPTIMRWTAKITDHSTLKAGTNSDMVIDVSDLLPTFCELAGATPPVGLDGVSLAPTLTGTGHQRTRDYLIHEAGNNASIIRGKYKLIMNRGSKGKKAGRGKKDRKPKDSGDTPPGALLYDLVADHAETNDIAAENPELVEELTSLLLAEHVRQPAGFANTYHDWTGTSGADMAAAENWSDYTYANAGITYMTDSGAPRGSWTARMHNTSGKPNIAQTKSDVAFLGLEIGGKKGAEQEVVVSDGAKVTGRNEIRVAAQGILTLDGGAVASLRWIDALEGGTLRGKGKVDASVYNAGTVDPKGLKISRNYHEHNGAKLDVALAGAQNIPLVIDGNAELAGTLAVTLAEGFQPSAGTTFTLLTATRVQGSFANAESKVTAGAVRFKIGYSGDAVILTVQ